MNALGIAVFVFLCIWLGVLTLVAILLVRQVGLLTVRLSLIGNGLSRAGTGISFSLDADGPDVGSTVPEEVAAALPEVAGQRSYVLLISATCGPCRELVMDLDRHEFGPNTTALVAGRDVLADALVAHLPTGMGVIRDPNASRLAEALQIKSVPFGLEIEDGAVTKKAYLRRASDLVALVQGQDVAGPGKPTPSGQEVSYVG